MTAAGAALLLAGFCAPARASEPGPYAPADALIERSSGALANLESCVAERAALLSTLTADRGDWKLAPKGELGGDGAPAPGDDAPPAEPLDPQAARERRLDEVCGADIPVERIIKDKDLARLGPFNGIPRAANAFVLCRALASGDDADCGELAAIPDFGADHAFMSSKELCRAFFRHVAMSKALITHDPSAREQCLKWGPGAEKAFRPATNAGQCDLLLKAEKDAGSVCAAAIAKGIETPFDDWELCRRTARAHWGLAPPCDPANPPASPRRRKDQKPRPGGDNAAPHLRQLCLVSNAAAAFRKAFAAHDPGACGEDGVCRAMMSAGPESCQGYAAQIQTAKREFCRSPALRSWTRAELAEMEKERGSRARERERRAEELKRAAERSKRAADEEAAWRAEREGRRAGARSSLEALDSACLRLEAESRAALDGVLSAIDGIEPKGLPGLDARRAAFESLKGRWSRLGAGLHAAP